MLLFHRSAFLAPSQSSSAWSSDTHLSEGFVRGGGISTAWHHCACSTYGNERRDLSCAWSEGTYSSTMFDMEWEEEFFSHLPNLR